MAGPRAFDFLLPLLEARELLLTATPAAARSLRHAFDDSQRRAGHSAWEPARALAWSHWTSSLFAELLLSGRETRLLLNHTQELSLWEEVIAADRDTASLGLQRDAVADLAELAHTAFATAAAHRLRSAALTLDEQIFARWAETFTRGCTRRGYLPPAQLEDALAEHLRSGALASALPQALHLVLLPQLTPAQRSLLAALEEQGVAITKHERPPAAGDPLHLSTLLPTEADERAFAARWIRSLLDDDSRRPPSIALAVPSLDDHRTELEAELRAVLAPELSAVGADLSSTPWAFPAGQPLASLPILACVLDLARWATGALPLPVVSSLLLSPFLGDPAEHDAAAVFDAQVLRRSTLLQPELDLSTLRQLARFSRPIPNAAAPSWIAPLHEAAQRLDPERPRTFAEWMEALRSLADAAGWPGRRPLSAAEFAATRAFEGALDAVATLDALGGDRDRRVPFAAALRTLQHQLRRTRESSPAEAPLVHLVSPEELATNAFDAVLFLHATDRNWPPAARPHPFLARSLQREAGLPGSQPEQAIALARETMAALLHATPRVLFTCARQDADGKLRPSPLLAQSGLSACEPETLLAPAQEPAPLALDLATDPIALPPLPGAQLRGGSSLLKQQAACGFLAFAELRLRSAPPEERDAGMDPRERGNLIHNVLQAFWKVVETHAALKAYSETERRGILSHLIDDELARIRTGPERWPERSPERWSAAYLQLVRERTLHVLSAWLAHELERGEFRVLDTEKEATAELGPVHLAVRIDRVDELPNGGLVYVDYKTGKPRPRDWEGPRPADPQLPLYAVIAEPGRLQGLLFATVRTGNEAGWTGMQTEPDILPMKRPVVTDLDARAVEWRSILTSLAEDFAAGRAHVDPLDPAVNCEHCAQRLLCRRDAADLRDSLLPTDDADRSPDSAFTELFGGWDD